MKLIIDTNIFYSAIGFDNAIYDFVYSVFASVNCRVYCSTAIMDELKAKLFSPKFDQKTKNRLSEKQKSEFISILTDNVIFVESFEKLAICRDPDDDKFLELALAIDADFIISGDKDLLELTQFQNTKILKPSQFIALNLL
jgi:uncharacterized protein